MKKILLWLGLALALPAAFAAKDLFKAMDENHDGRISADEHAAGARALFQKMDANQDGKVTAKGLDELRTRMPFADIKSFEKDPKLSAISDLFTVDMIAKYIEGKLAN